MRHTHKARSGEPKRVRPQATERQGHSGLLLVEPSVPPPVPSAASWASRSGPGFANTSYVNTALRSDTKAMCASAPGYRYAIVNDRSVIVEPRSRRIVEIIE